MLPPPPLLSHTHTIAIDSSMFHARAIKSPCNNAPTLQRVKVPAADGAVRHLNQVHLLHHLCVFWFAGQWMEGGRGLSWLHPPGILR